MKIILASELASFWLSSFLELHLLSNKIIVKTFLRLTDKSKLNLNFDFIFLVLLSFTSNKSKIKKTSLFIVPAINKSYKLSFYTYKFSVILH